MAHYAWIGLAACLALSGCSQPPAGEGTQPSIVLLSVTHDTEEDPQAVDMAMKLAGFSLDEGRRVVMFFNVRGVKVPVQSLPADIAYQQNAPIRAQLEELIERGVEVHVCPICMKAHEVEGSQLIEGAQVTTRSGLFANIGPGTTVFTY